MGGMMITCKQCIEDLRPDDPRIRSGRYRMCGCDYCNKPSYFRELELSTEEVARPQEIIHRHSNMGAKEFDLLQQTAMKVDHLEGQFKEQQARRKPRGKY